MADWKVVLVVLLGLLLITIGLFTEIGLNMGGFGKQVSDTLGKSVALDFWKSEGNGNITIEGNFYIDELNLRTIPLKEVKVVYHPSLQNKDILLSDTKLTTNQQTEIQLSEYTGTFNINQSRLDMSGNSEKVTVNGVKFETVKKLIPVEMKSVSIDQIYVKELSMNRIELQEVSGKISLQKKIDIKLTGEPLKLEGFKGSLNVTEGNYEIKGIVSRIFVSGNEYTATVG